MQTIVDYLEVHGLVHGFLFGALGVSLALVSYFMFDFLDRKIHYSEEVKNGNMSAAVVLGSFVIGICIIISSVIGG